jgi:type IV secretion system protein VirB5
VANGIGMNRNKEEEATMRQLILAGTSALAIGASAGPVHAQWTVIDPSNLAQAVQQVRQLQMQLQTMQAQYQQLQQTYQAISHLPQDALNRMGRELNTDQFRNALPNVSSLNGMMNGQQLNSLAQQYLNQNRVYQPSGPGFATQEIGRNAQSIANAQSMASGLYTSASNRVDVLRQLEGTLDTAPDTKAVADIQARLAMEQTTLQAQQVQAQALTMWQASQERNEQQRREESSRQEIDQLIEEAKRHGG